MWFRTVQHLLLLLVVFLVFQTEGFAGQETIQATCPSTAYMAGSGPWSSGVRFTFDKAEIYVYNNTTQHLRCWYKSPTGGNSFLAGYNEVRNGYDCTIVDNNKFICRKIN